MSKQYTAPGHTATGNGDDDLSGAFYNGKHLTNREYKALVAQAESNGQEVDHRTQLGKRRAPSRWTNVGRDKDGVMWQGRIR